MGVNSRHQIVGGIGVSNLLTVQITVAGTATLLLASRQDRAGLMIEQLSGSPVALYLGPDATVTTGNSGLVLAPTQWTPLSLSYTGALWAITAGGSNLVGVTELW